MMHALSAAVVLAVTIGATPPAQQGATAAPAGSSGDAELGDVRRLINAGEPRQALERLRGLTAGTDDERRHRIALLRGVAHYHADEPASAVEALAPLVGRLPSDSMERKEAQQVLGLSLFVIGRAADAIPHLEATRAWAPANDQLGHALGQAYIQVQRADEARDVLATVYGLEPDSAAAHLIAAQIMLRLEQDPLAENELRRAVSKDPRLPGANILLGQVALFRGRLDEAVTLTLRELEINPASAAALSQLGDAYVRQARWDEAAAALQKSIWLNPYYSAPYILLGRTYQNTQDAPAAEGMFRRAIEYDPNNRTAHYLLARLLQQLGRDDEAAREFEIAERLRGTRAP